MKLLFKHVYEKSPILRKQFIPVLWVYCIYIQSNAGRISIFRVIEITEL